MQLLKTAGTIATDAPTQTLAGLLSSCTVAAGHDVTHTSFTGGRFYVPSTHVDELLRLYSRALQLSPTPGLSLTERHRHIGPVIIDLDLRIPFDGKTSTPPSSVATRQRVEDFVTALCEELSDLLQLDACPDTAPLEIYVLEKPPRPAPKKAVIKDGVHFVIPDVVTRPEMQHILRERMLPHVHRIFCTPTDDRECGYPAHNISPAAEVYDAAVIQRNGWFLVGSKKPDEPVPWTPTRVLLWDAHAGLRDRVDPPLPPPPELVGRLSIRNKYDELPPPTPLGAQLLAVEVQRTEEAHARRLADAELHTQALADGAPPEPLPPGRAQEVKDLLAMLHDRRAIAYEPWSRVGFMLYNVLSGSEEAERLWRAFSARGGAAYSPHGCDQLWAGLQRKHKHGAGLGMGSLVLWAREDSPDHLKEWQRARAKAVAAAELGVGAATLRALPDGKEDWSGLCLALASRWPEVFGGGRLDDCAFERLAGGAGVRFQHATNGLRGCVTAPAMGVAVEPDGSPPRFLGLLYPDVPVKGSLDWLHNRIHSEADFLFNHDTARTATLRAVAPHENCASVTLSNPLTDDSVAHVEVAGRTNYTVRGPKVIKLNKKLLDCIKAHVMASAMEAVGADRALALPDGGAHGVTNWVVNLTNYGTINVGFDPDADRHTDEELAQLVLRARPELMQRLRFVPSARTGNSSGVYYCDPATNLWAPKHHTFLELLLLEAIMAPDVDALLTPSDRRHAQSRRGRDDLRYCVVSRCLDEDFRLNDNLDVYPMRNGVIEMPSCRFRPLTPEDRISVSTPWSYDPQAAAAHRPELEKFLAQILPVPEEREVVLAFFASLLTGNRAMKTFLALTDRRAGNNGKTTLMALMEHFFGGLMAKDTSTTKLVCKGAHDRGRDQHDEGLRHYAGVRLVVADELNAQQTLDDALIKNLTGGCGVRVGGRGCGSADRFSYTWQAGIVMLMNEGAFPRFPAEDLAFTARMTVVPMRGKFVDAAQLAAAADEPHTFLVDPTISSRFASWCSAMADVFMERFVLSLPDVPTSMREWRADLTAEANPVAEWLQERVVVTGDAADIFLLADVRRAYANSGHAAVGGARVAGLARAYIAALPGVSVKDGHKVRGTTTRGVVLGARLKETGL